MDGTEPAQTDAQEAAVGGEGSSTSQLLHVPPNQRGYLHPQGACTVQARGGLVRSAVEELMGNRARVTERTIGTTGRPRGRGSADPGPLAITYLAENGWYPFFTALAKAESHAIAIEFADISTSRLSTLYLSR